jgi:hypothetical protein
MKVIFILIIILMILTTGDLFPQDESGFDRKKFYALALDGNIPAALTMLSSSGPVLKEDEAKIREEFEKRFAKADDESEYLLMKNSPVSDMLVIYRDYWRSSFLSGRNLDTALKKELTGFFNAGYLLGLSRDSVLDDDNLDVLVKKYVNDNGMKTTGFAMTGKFYDLLIWRNEQDTVYEFELNGKKISQKVVFMSDFVTLGWEEYATLGRHYPGGWAATDAVYCVRDAYDVNSENFLISFLAHEGQHFEDYKQFPKLSGTDLEYRAKLVELSMARETLHSIVNFFLNNADRYSSNSHAIANYCVMRDLSREIFRKDLETDRELWEIVPAEIINRESLLLLNLNTENLKSEGSDVRNYIKP